MKTITKSLALNDTGDPSSQSDKSIHKSNIIPSPFHITDYDKSIKSKNIPIWQCSRCTFTNTTRKSNCSICNLSYKKSKSYTSKQSKAKAKAKYNKKPKKRGFSNVPKDFCR